MNQILWGDVCYDEKSNIMYGFAKMYNGFYAVDFNSKITTYLGRLEDEKDEPDLIFKIYYWNDKLVFTPDNASNIYIYDLISQKQFVIPWGNKYKHRKSTRNILAYVYKNNIYLFFRLEAEMYNLNMEQKKLERIYEFDKIGMTNIAHIDEFGKKIILYEANFNKIYLLDFSEKKFKKIYINKFIKGNFFAWHTFEKIYISNDKKISVFDFDGKFKEEIDMGKEESTIVIAKIIGTNTVMIIPNKQYCFMYGEKEIKKIQITDLRVRSNYLFSLGENAWILQQEIKTKDLFPKVQYFKYDLEKDSIVEIHIPLPYNESESEIINKSQDGSYQYWCKNILMESVTIKIDDLLLAVDKKKEKEIFRDVESIGTKIYSNEKGDILNGL